jgi:hypothetical protein
MLKRATPALSIARWLCTGQRTVAIPDIAGHQPRPVALCLVDRDVLPRHDVSSFDLSFGIDHSCCTGQPTVPRWRCRAPRALLYAPDTVLLPCRLICPANASLARSARATATTLSRSSEGSTPRWHRRLSRSVRLAGRRPNGLLDAPQRHELSLVSLWCTGGLRVDTVILRLDT